VLKWVFERITGGGAAVETPIGNLPAAGALDINGLDIAPGALDVLLKVDAQGWLYVSAEDGIHVFDPDGTLLGKILVPERTGNCTWGEADRATLYIAASTSLYRISLDTHGATRPHA